MVVTAHADPAYIGGEFTGDEPEVFNIHGTCTAAPLPYQQVGPFTVSQAGSYVFQDAGVFWGLDTEVSIHTGPVNVNNPQGNLVGAVDDGGSIALATGTQYYLVSQPWCSANPGVWAFAIRGPGNINGGGSIPAPDWAFGSFDGSEYLGNFTGSAACPQTYYEVTGPVQFARTGTYFLAGVDSNSGDDLLVAVYRDSFNPSAPNSNRVALGIAADSFRLQAGVEYFFVVQPYCELRTGDWQFVLFPPGPFQLNPGLNGSWDDPTTSAQGVFLDIFPNVGVAFLAWFTYDSIAPNPAETREVGKPGNSWLVAQGNFQPGDASVEITLYFQGGGRFNDPGTAPNPIEEAGSGTLEFDSCLGGTLTYDLDSGLQGSVILNRIAGDNIDLCESLVPGPGVLE
jgi:hypothetical protein